MRILFLTKQQYMGKDLLRDRFGRFYEIPRALAQSGHRVRAVCLKYWSAKSETKSLLPCDAVQWSSIPLGRNWPLGFFKHYRQLKKIAAAFSPDIIVGASDAFQVVLASWLSAKLGIPYAVDLYDNFESYRATQIPGIKTLFRDAVKKASAVSVVSENLRAKVEQEYRPSGIVRTLTNAIDPELFFPADKMTARRRLGLPGSEKLIGTAGSLTRGRGIDTLYQAFDLISVANPNLSLVLAGPIEPYLASWPGERIIYLGQLSQDQVGDLFNALDLGIICNRDGAFGRYCFPQKLFEMLACNLPVVAAGVGAMRDPVFEAKNCLFDPENAKSLADAIVAQLMHRQLPGFPIPTWKDRSRELGEMLAAAVESDTRSRGPIHTMHTYADKLLTPPPVNHHRNTRPTLRNY